VCFVIHGEGMNRSWCGLAGVLAVVLVMWMIPSCGREQQLVSITVQPATETFGAANIPVPADAGLQVQLRALGTYIHPPVTKDITANVAWVSNDTQMMTVSPTGLLTAAGQSCGSTLVSATVATNRDASNQSSSGAIVTGYMTGNVVCFTSNGAAIGPALTMALSGTGSGTVSSSPQGLGCASTCTGNFPSGTAVTLTAAPNGSTFRGWTGCDTASGPVCTVNLTNDRTVTATFN
jgi:uncharacterized repeat protein (TIGR02543 family)